MKKTIFCILFVFIISPTYVWGAGCNCGAVRSIVKASERSIIQSVNTNTSAEAQSIRSEILVAAQSIIGTIKIEAATIVRAIIALKESNADQLKSLGIAQEVQKSKDLYGAKARPSLLCGGPTVGAGIQISAQERKKVHIDMRRKQIQYANDPNSRPIENLDRLLSKDHPDVNTMVETMFPIEQTLTDEQVSKAQETIKSLANPFPIPVPTPDQKESLSGENYEAARLIHQGRIAVAQETLTAHVAYRSPTLPDDVTEWAEEEWKASESVGTPPGVVNGKLSEAGLYQLLSQMRMGNPNWFAQVTSATQAGLLRELVLMQAMELELTRKNSVSLDRIAFMTALGFLTRMENEQGKEIEDLYIRMIGSQQ